MADNVVVASPEAAPPIEPLVPDATLEPVKPEPKTYSQEDLDRIVNKVKKNARYQTKKEVEAYYQGRDSRPEPRQPVANGEDKAPERGDFDSYEEFLEAKSVFAGGKAASERLVKERNEAKEREAVQAQQKVFTDFRTKTQAKYPDLEERLEAIADIQMPPGMGPAIAESELGPDILDYFAKNPKDCERIAALSPSAAIREIGKLEAKLEGAGTKPKKTASEIPAPINPGGGGSPSDDVPKDSDNINDWMRKENARDRKQAGVG